ncbi:polysaccharide biosynthesis tyrosine autokinase [Saxibacter everestensis]|uniref:non-specific protein-tyrosine kinase n=1 Tax=Saxibacter everestensis TaxID=2909229 RepID=A0ABY8QT87_9MICO|nr:polysaccharide biosynthesis tyrosine autokinase [Brevibacteriaceae bacterium ZFBP1038]
MELRDYLRILHKSWVLIVACTLVGVGAAAAYSILVSPKYDATTKLYVSVRSSNATSVDLAQGTTFARQAVISYVDIASSARVLDQVIDELSLATSAKELSATIEATSPAETSLIEITTTAESPQQAADIANSVGKNLQTVVVDELEKPEGDDESPVKIATIQPALAPSAPASPNLPLNLALGMLVGLAIGLGVAVLRSVLDTRLHSSHDIALVTEKPILGGISFDPQTKKRPLVVHADPRNPHSEAFRSLRTNLQFMNVENGPRSYVVTSSVPSEGKSTTVANLAIALAETGARVALVDGDLRMPTVAENMGLEGAVGLTDVLIGRAELDEVLQKWGRGQLFVLPSGQVPPNPSELLGSKAMSRLLDELLNQFDYVLVDAPPLLLVTDAALISKITGGAILVAASGSTKRNELAAAVRALEHIGSRLLGIVITMLPTKGPDSYGYGQYSYGVNHQDDPEVAAVRENVEAAAKRSGSVDAALRRRSGAKEPAKWPV